MYIPDREDVRKAYYFVSVEEERRAKPNNSFSLMPEHYDTYLAGAAVLEKFDLIRSPIVEQASAEYHNHFDLMSGQVSGPIVFYEVARAEAWPKTEDAGAVGAISGRLICLVRKGGASE